MAQRLFDRWTIPGLRLLGAALGRIEIMADGKAALAVLDLAPPIKNLFARKMMFGAQAW